MSRRCRNSLTSSGGTLTGGDLSSGCDCGRLVGGKPSAPCTEPLIFGELSKDVGFELGGNGPGGDEIAWAGPSVGDPSRFVAYWSDNSTTGVPIWVQTGDPAQPINWVISSGDPSAGLLHAQLDYSPGAQNTGQFGLWVPPQYWCVDSTVGWSFRVTPGDLLVTSIDMKADIAVAGAGAPRHVKSLTFFDANLSVVPGGTKSLSLTDLTSSYVTYQDSIFVPPLSLAGDPIYRATLIYRANLNLVGGSGEGSILADNASVQLIGVGATGIILCAQASLITIDNSTTETAFL